MSYLLTLLVSKVVAINYTISANKRRAFNSLNGKLANMKQHHREGVGKGRRARVRRSRPLRDPNASPI
jgi:hypothetical protein